MSIWTPCPVCGEPLVQINHDNGCPHIELMFGYFDENPLEDPFVTVQLDIEPTQLELPFEN